MDKDKARLKKKELIRRLKDLGPLVVAFSGGVDSTFLLAMAHQVLGEEVLAVTSSSITYPNSELEQATKFARERDIQHIVIQSDEINLPEFVSNGPERCYHCKRALCKSLLEIAGDRGLGYVVHAANADDLNDYRPGLRAAREMGVLAPLVDVHLGKEEIRFLSKEMGLPTWDKPAMACLASRIPYGDVITEAKLGMIREAEEFLDNNGFRQYRVRHHGSVARIEVESSEIQRITRPELRKALVKGFRHIGFDHIAVDLEGYVPGSMNRELLDTDGKGTKE